MPHIEVLHPVLSLDTSIGMPALKPRQYRPVVCATILREALLKFTLIKSYVPQKFLITL